MSGSLTLSFNKTSHTTEVVNLKALARQIVKQDALVGLETDFNYARAMVKEYMDMGILDELVEQYYANTPENQLNELVEMGVA